MPAEKTARNAERKRIRNRRVRSATRTILSKAADALQGGQQEAAETPVAQAVRALDSAATKGIIHRKNAARKKSRLMAKLNAAREKQAGETV